MILAACLLASCAHVMDASTDPEYYRDVWRMYDLSRHAFEQRTGATLPSGLRARIRNIVLHPGINFDCKFYSGKCKGEIKSVGGGQVDIHIATGYPCLPETSLAHEFMHFFSSVHYLDYDPGHSRVSVFPIISKPKLSMMAAEVLANVAGAHEGLCD